MIDIFLGPRRYIQREGILAEAANYFQPFGRRPMVLGDDLVLSIVRPILEDRLSGAGFSPAFVHFGDDCSLSEVSRLAEIVRQKKVGFHRGHGRRQGHRYRPNRRGTAAITLDHGPDQRRNLFGRLLGLGGL